MPCNVIVTLAVHSPFASLSLSHPFPSPPSSYFLTFSSITLTLMAFSFLLSLFYLYTSNCFHFTFSLFGPLSYLDWLLVHERRMYKGREQRCIHQCIEVRWGKRRFKGGRVVQNIRGVLSETGMVRNTNYLSVALS